MIRSGEHVLWEAHVASLRRRSEMRALVEAWNRAAPHLRAALRAYGANAAKASEASRKLSAALEKAR